MADSAEQILEFLKENVLYFAGATRTEADVLARFSPNGFQRTDGSAPVPDLPFLIESAVTKSLKIRQPIDGVIWWKNPKPGSHLEELHLVLGAYCRILPYDDLVKSIPLKGGSLLPRAHPLGDLQYEHFLGDGSPVQCKIIIHKIAWPVELIGKIGEIAIVIAAE